MQAPLATRTVDFLLTLDLGTAAQREALLSLAQFDRALINRIDCSQPPIVFAAHCVEMARTYGRGNDGTPAMVQLLNAAVAFAGAATKQWCAELRAEWELQTDEQNLPEWNNGGAPPLKIVRNCLEEAFTIETLPGFCQERFRTVYIRWEPAHGFDRLLRDLLGYCEQRGEMERLWYALQAERPAAYAKYYPQWQQARKGPADHLQ